MEFKLWPLGFMPDDCCFAKNSMKPRGHSLNSTNEIYVSNIYLFIIYIYIYII